jgi:hypothetical protein
MDQKFGSDTRTLLDNHCTHVLGDYWEVWGKVFHANLTQYESGSSQVLWGLTFRSQVTRDLWLPPLDGGLVAVVRSPKSEEGWLREAESLQLPALRAVRETPTVRILATGTTGQPLPEFTADAAPLRAYGAADMAIQKCMKREEDGTIIGENCPPGSVVFGPYARIGKGATLRVTFEFQAERKLKLISDVVSAGGQIFHGAIDEQELEPKTVRALAYRIHMFQDAIGTEARIWIMSDSPANFRITNLKLVVL